MRNLGFHRALAVLFLVGSAFSLKADGRHAPVIPKQYIVEFSKGSAVSRRDLESAGIKLIRSYSSEIFTGAAIEVAQDKDAHHYADAPHVVNLWPNRAVPRQAPLDFQSFSGHVAVSNYSTLQVTGVEQLHEAGILGHGVKVGVLDSGIWYDHPDLGGGFGPGFKVAGGWDFVGNGAWPDGPKEPNPDPKDPLNSYLDVGHGTHVAGIIAAEGKKFVGVAPKATLYAYKIMALRGTDDATTVDAFLRAYADGMDVITLSVSGPSGWAENAVGVVASRIARTGVVVTIAAANDGDNGPFYANTAAGPDVLAVSSVQAETTAGQPYKITYSLHGVSNTTVSGYLSDDHFPPEVANWPVVALNLDPTRSEDACVPYPVGTRSLTGVVALVRRGSCAFSVKQRNLQALGAKYVLVYNDGRALVPPGNTDRGSLLGLIPENAGRAMVELIRDGGNVTVDFSHVDGIVGLPDPAGGLLNTFTSWGGTYELQLKPEIAAPGGNIFSTWVNNSYAIMSGTSMAAPYMAGVAALYISAFGGRKQHGPDLALAFKRRVLASGSSLQWFNGTYTDSRFMAPPLQVGTGLVNAVKVLYANTTLDPVKLHLNDTANFRCSHELTVANYGPVPVTYNFTLEPAAGLEIFDPWIPMWGTWGIKKRKDLVPIDMVPDVQFPDPIMVGPGESKKVILTFVNPENKGWNATVIPTYSGKVVVAGSNGEQLSVLYMGVASNLLKHKPVFQAPGPVSFSGSNYVSINNKSSYTFNLTKDAFDFPQIDLQLDWGVRELRWDIFKANWSESEWKYPPTAARGFVGPVARFSGDRSAPNLDLTNATFANQTITMPDTFLPRNGFFDRSYIRLWWLGQLGNGSQIRPGHYTMRVAASKPFGNLESTDGWEVWRREIQVLPLR